MKETIKCIISVMKEIAKWTISLMMAFLSLVGFFAGGTGTLSAESAKSEHGNRSA